MLNFFSLVCNSNGSSQANSLKGLCVNHRNASIHHHRHLPSSGHGSSTDADSLPVSECDDGSDRSRSSPPAFFIGDDYCSECYTEYVDRGMQTEELVDKIAQVPSVIAELPLKIPRSPSCPRALTDDHELQLYGLEAPEVADANDAMEIRDMKTLTEMLQQEDGCNLMNDREIQLLVEGKKIPAYKLENVLGNAQRGVAIRRRLIENSASKPRALKECPYLGYDYKTVLGACCENVIGYMPIPLGVAGPLYMNGKKYYVPMATTEGCLVASTNRGCRAISMSLGLQCKVYADGMTRGPVLHFRSAMEAAEAMEWLNIPKNFDLIKSSFDSTSRFARLQRVHARVAGRYLYLRFKASTGDAMGMNMLSKGTELALEELSKHVTGLEMKCLSGNFCTDKKPSSVNWIEGRGKSVVCEVIVPRKVVEDVLKTCPEALVELNISKNLIGSSIAGSIGGNNAQAANIVAAIYIATGQVSQSSSILVYTNSNLLSSDSRIPLKL